MVLLLSALPNLYTLFNTPKNTTYTFAHNYIPDYYQYISFMKDGANGKILMTFRTSPDNFARKPVYLFYTVSGFIFSKIGVNLFIGYFALRIVFSFLKFLLLLYLLMQIFPKSPTLRKLAFFFVVFSTAFYQINPLAIYYPAVTSIDPLVRAVFLPHDLLTMIFIILGAVFLNRWLEEKGQKKDILVSGFCFLSATVTNPAMLTTFGSYFAVASVLYLIADLKNWKKLLIGVAVIGLITLPVYLYYQILFTTTLPFSWLLNNQGLVDYQIGLKEFIVVGGPILILAIFSIPKFFSRRDFLTKLIISWAFLPFILFQLYGKYLPLSQERIFESGFYIPLAILGATTIYSLPKNYLKSLTVIVLLIFFLPYFYLSLTKHLQEYNGNYFNIDVPNSTIEAFNWLDKNSPDESVVAAGYFTSNILIAFTHNKVVYGHDFSTYKGPKRFIENNIIYSNQSTESQIKKVLNKENVSYIIFTPENRRYEDTNLKSLNNLKLVFANPGNAIYYYQK